MPGEIWLIRHGETEWSRTGKHTGRTDLPLTLQGQERARLIGRHIRDRKFALVLTSPLERARETCRLAGLGDAARIDPDLREWDYGAYEGRTTAEIRELISTWSLWLDGVPEGETIEQVADRAEHVLERSAAADGDVALFAHGHILRILGVCWVGLPSRAARLFTLDTASVSALGYERETRVIRSWNRCFFESGQ